MRLDFIWHEGTRTGLSISEALKIFGLVEHSVWLEGGNFQGKRIWKMSTRTTA
jgi:hypothetical protein